MTNTPLSVEMVWSLFCGLPYKESRMAVILSASDETYRDKFVYGGLLAPVKYWEGIFAPRWERLVLSGLPEDKHYLHMTDIRKQSWREEVGISREDAERRVDNAVQILCKRKEPTWIGFEFAHDKFNKDVKRIIQMPTGRKPFVAEYFGFLGYVHAVLKYVREMYPGARKVDFLVEKNGDITKNLHHFYDNYEPFLKEIGAIEEVGMLGEIIPGGKERSPLQAADLMCWHLRRMREESLEGVDLERYHRLDKKQYAIGLLPDSGLTKFRDKLKRAVENGAEEQ